ncbi:MAG: hypothetical protein Q7U75_02540, partial [Desulfobacterales bacterium]|nr:hypothetical protein [Desulfobacterales bacterium]
EQLKNLMNAKNEALGNKAAITEEIFKMPPDRVEQIKEFFRWGGYSSYIQIIDDSITSQTALTANNKMQVVAIMDAVIEILSQRVARDTTRTQVLSSMQTNIWQILRDCMDRHRKVRQNAINRI